MSKIWKLASSKIKTSNKFYLKRDHLGPMTLLQLSKDIFSPANWLTWHFSTPARSEMNENLEHKTNIQLRAFSKFLPTKKVEQDMC
jgi:hypothetical protein